jgi:PAS domain S-box-containing protein
MSSRKSDSVRQSTWVRYGVAVGSVVIAWLAREALTPGVGPTALPFIFFFPAAAMAAWYGGFAPGLLATLLGAAVADWFFIEPTHAWSVSRFGDVVALTAFIVCCLFIVGAIEAMHRARARAQAELTARERAEAELARMRQTFAATLGSVGNVAGATDMHSRGPFLKAESRGPKPAARLISFVFLAAAVLLTASTIFVYRVGLIRIHGQEAVESQLLVLQQLDDFLSSLKDTETGQRGYLLTGEEPYLQPYTDVRDVMTTKLDGLQRLGLSGELPKEKMERIAVLTQEKLTKLEQGIQARRDKGLDAALSTMRDNQGKRLMDEIRVEIGQMRAAEEKEFAAANRRAERATKLRTETFIGMCLLNLVFLGWAFRKISGEVCRRETAIRETAIRETSQQKELLATTLGSIGDAVIATDADGRVLFLNAEAEKLTGWNSSEAAARPLTEIFRIFNEHTRQPAENPVEKVFRTGKVAGLANHTVLMARNGTETPIDDSAAPIREPDGPLFGVVLVFRDVSEQREAQRASARLAAIVEHSGDAIFTKDLDGIIQTWNPAAERLLGYRTEEIVGKPMTTLLPPDRFVEEDHILTRIRQGRPVERLETIRVAKDGRCIPVAVSVSPLKNGEGELIGASKVIHDITDLVAAREALVREKELLATTLASIGDAVIVTDSEGRITFLNAEAERLTKWSNADAAGHPLPKVFRIINEQTRQPVENPVEKVLRIGGVVGLANHTVLIAKDETETPIDDSAAPIREPGGPLFGVVLVFRDFTQRKETEQRLRELSLFPTQNPAPILRVSRDGTLIYANPSALEQLHDWKLAIGEPATAEIRSLATDALNARRPAARELTVGARSYLISIVPIPESDYANLYWIDVTERKQAEEALQQAHEQLAGRAIHLDELVHQRTARLQETIGELEAFSYSIAHDMRAPLRAMQGFASILQKEHATQLDATAQKYLQRIEAAAHRMDRFIVEILNYSKIVRGTLDSAPVDLEKLIRDIVASYPALHDDKADITIDSPLPRVLANDAALTQVVSNLLGNAVKFVAPGTRPRVRVHSEGTDGVVRLWFEDNGIGIPKDSQPRVFNIFTRLNRPELYEGTGIGLAIVRKAVERMGGSVGVESTDGQGSRFWVQLRAAKEL